MAVVVVGVLVVHVPVEVVGRGHVGVGRLVVRRRRGRVRVVGEGADGGGGAEEGDHQRLWEREREIVSKAPKMIDSEG